MVYLFLIITLVEERKATVAVRAGMQRHRACSALEKQPLLLLAVLTLPYQDSITADPGPSSAIDADAVGARRSRSTVRDAESCSLHNKEERGGKAEASNIPPRSLTGTGVKAEPEGRAERG
ncbi:hypothetical protein A4R35_02895 [Thermogemmatispora tikiterensis]|uniref:Uncharacterized protein n=1 Tax=Thermogemmatispora tikiterensis TaxID=1825093 RepID=A0A328VJM7_9CHLR|nr:hypothetical protein A4R35_02895 [Thermogemmatispora tikiterensis]